MQLYSRSISANPRNQESTRSLPGSDSPSHSTTVKPLPVSALMRLSVNDCMELMRLQVRADTAAHTISCPLTFLPACPCIRIPFAVTFTSITLSSSLKICKIIPLTPKNGWYYSLIVSDLNFPFIKTVVVFPISSGGHPDIRAIESNLYSTPCASKTGILFLSPSPFPSTVTEVFPPTSKVSRTLYIMFSPFPS